MEANNYFFVVHFTEKDGSKGVEWYEIGARYASMARLKAWTEATKKAGRVIRYITEVDGIRSMQDLTNLVAFGINPGYTVHYHFHVFHEED